MSFRLTAEKDGALGEKHNIEVILKILLFL